MSNVLIGIIGVILFIGLALAGALFLGPRFQEATQNSKASALIQAVKQVADADEMFTTQEGRYAVDEQDLLSSHYLKSIPTSPVDGSQVHIEDAGFDTWVAMLPLDQSYESYKLCAAIVKQTTGKVVTPTDGDVYSVGEDHSAPAGCLYDSAMDNVVVYAKISGQAGTNRDRNGNPN